MDTIENNKIIAEFMNAIDIKRHDNLFITSYKYHSDWNWLMKVVGKIESLEDNNSLTNCFKQSNKVCELPIYTKIEMVYNACIEFIKWYNEQKEV